ncbi:MAG: aldo/keto reductase [Pirellulales bacterium]
MMADNQVTRREFVRDGALGAAALAAGVSAATTVKVGCASEADQKKILNYNPDMEYRRCGKTNWMISAVCLGGHWKRVNEMVPSAFKAGDWLGVNVENPGFAKNRYEVVTRCIERGINYIDACTGQEVLAYSKALEGRRDKMHLGYSWYQKEARFAEWRTTDKLMQSLDEGMKAAKLEYIDLWRITCHEGSSGHSEAEIENIVAALDKAKKQGKARATGISSHDRPHIKKLIEKYPAQFDVIVTPYTAKTKMVEDESGLWAAMKKCDVGWFGIKPFAGTSLFKGSSHPDSPTAKEDDKLARLAIRYILCNGAITAPIPGMINEHQVDNVALAIKESRELDKTEKAVLEEATDRMWANLPYHYQWLKDWEYV